MSLFLFFACSLFFGCFAAPSVDDPLHSLQQEMEELKRSNEESIEALKLTFGDKIRENAEKIAHLGDRAEWGRNLSSQMGKMLIFSVKDQSM